MEPSLDPVAARIAVSTWYAAHGRHLRFRETRDPWAVLVSEVMLQQTQVSRMEPAWAAFMSRFPTPVALASATPADALRAWSGLGYNRRALNLWRAAVAMVERYGGAVPQTMDELQSLPGVGGYTARAVAAIAFGQPAAAVDTNVRRVVGRACWGTGGAPSADALQSVADRLVDPRRPDAWTHAIMDIGATICRPRDPACGECPLNGMCAYAALRAEAAPVRHAGTRAPIAPVRTTKSRIRRTPAEPFPATTRWLRGRIVDRLRQAEPGDWVEFEGPLGDHGIDSVASALDALAAEGLLERGERGRVRLPLTYGAQA